VTAAPPRRRGGWLVAAATAIIIVGAGALLLPRLRSTPRPPQPAVATAPAVETAPAPPPAVAPETPAPTTVAPPPPAAAVPVTPASAPTPEPSVAIAADSVSSLGTAVGGQAQQIAALTARIATLEAAIGNSARLQDIAKRMDSLEARSAEAGAVLSLSERVNALEHASRSAVAEQGARIGQLLAVAQLREAIAAGRPYGLELESVKALSARAGSAVLDAAQTSLLAAHATTGIATAMALRDRFDETAARVLRAEIVPDRMSSWASRAIDRVLALVTVRRVDGLVEGSTPSAILARAGAHLGNGNLAACVAELDALRGAPADAAQLWLDEARARVQAEQAISDATVRTIAALAPATTPAKAEP
jgi:uroporphyrinogen-III synthase